MKRGRKGRVPEVNVTELAERLGASKSHIARVLRGESRPSLDLALRLAEQLGTTAEKIRQLYVVHV